MAYDSALSGGSAEWTARGADGERRVASPAAAFKVDAGSGQGVAVPHASFASRSPCLVGQLPRGLTP